MQILQKQQNLQESLEVKELDYVEQKECSMQMTELVLFVDMIMAENIEQRAKGAKEIRTITKK